MLTNDSLQLKYRLDSVGSFDLLFTNLTYVTPARMWKQHELNHGIDANRNSECWGRVTAAMMGSALSDDVKLVRPSHDGVPYRIGR